MAEPIDKRDSDRLLILGGLHGEVMVFQPMALKDISGTGVQVETTFPLQLDTLHEFRFTLRDRSIVVKGRVTHCRICDVEHHGVLYRSGIEFITPSDHATRAIADFMDHARSI